MDANHFDAYFKKMPELEQRELASSWIKGEIIPETSDMVMVFRDRLFCLDIIC